MLPESPQVGAESPQIIVVPAVEVKAYGPDPDGQPAKTANLLRNPHHAPFVRVGIKRIPVVDDPNSHSQQNADRVRIEGMRGRYADFALAPVVVKDAMASSYLDLLHFTRQPA